MIIKKDNNYLVLSEQTIVDDNNESHIITSVDKTIPEDNLQIEIDALTSEIDKLQAKKDELELLLTN